MAQPKSQYPPGQTFFDSLRRNFIDVPVNKEKGSAIATTEFLEACDSLTTLFDLLGSAAFRPVKSDIAGNIKKLRDRQLAKPLESETVQSLVVNELKEGTHRASEGLLWLNRGLDFTSKAIALNLDNPNEELSVSFRAAYGDTLKPYHSFVVKPIFSAAMSATPYRKDFYSKLGDDQERVEQQGKEWLKALRELVDIIKEFMAKPEYQWK